MPKRPSHGRSPAVGRTTGASSYGSCRGNLRPVRRIARWRLERGAYALPVEKLVGDWLWPQPEMS